jgi:hypothetical protein
MQANEPASFFGLPPAAPLAEAFFAFSAFFAFFFSFFSGSFSSSESDEESEASVSDQAFSLGLGFGLGSDSAFSAFGGIAGDSFSFFSGFGAVAVGAVFDIVMVLGCGRRSVLRWCDGSDRDAEVWKARARRCEGATSGAVLSFSTEIKMWPNEMREMRG